MESRGAVAIVSGGMDSVTLAHLMASEGYDMSLLAFDYGQRHKKELGYAGLCAERLGAGFEVVDLSGVGRLLSGSALTDDIDVPHGHYAEETMAVTVVPNRNAIMLSVAYGVAVARGAEAVAAAVHAGDHYVYPDCRPAFVEAFDSMERLAVEGFGDDKLHLHAPFVHKTKAEIVGVGAELGVPYEETWSCYEGGEVHCGLCGTCTERREAFELAGVPDPTVYRDRQAARGVAVYTITKQFSFSASHVLEHLPQDHPCARLHGHNYVVELVLEGLDLNESGFVRDYRDLAPFKAFVDEKLDHRHLNDVVDGPTSAENLARFLYEFARGLWPEVAAVRVSETPKTWAEYRPGKP